MSEYQEYMGGEADVYEEGDVWQGQPIPVVMMQENAAPEFGSCMTWVVPVQGVGQPLQIAQRRVKRSECKIQFNFTQPGTIIVNSKLEGVANGQGYVFTTPVAGLFTMPDWESQQPIYAIASVTGITALVLDESYGDR